MQRKRALMGRIPYGAEVKGAHVALNEEICCLEAL